MRHPIALARRLILGVFALSLTATVPARDTNDDVIIDQDDDDGDDDDEDVDVEAVGAQLAALPSVWAGADAPPGAPEDDGDETPGEEAAAPAIPCRSPAEPRAS